MEDREAGKRACRGVRRPVLAALLGVALVGAWAPAALAAPGDLDPSFGTGGVVTTDFGIGREEYGGDVAVDAAGRTVVVGNAETATVDESSMAVARYTPSGVPDPAFGGGDGLVLLNLSPGDLDSAQAVAIDAAGRIVVVGTTREFLDLAVVRLTNAGQLDPTFGGGDGAFTIQSSSVRLSDVAIDPSGRIVAAGGAGSDMAVLRLASTGALDSTFGGDGIATVDFGSSYGHAYGVALDGSGRIVVAGGVEGEEGEADFGVARLLDNGSPDTTFSGDGRAVTDLKSLGNLDYPSGMAIDSLGRIVVVGQWIALPLGGPTHLALVRYTPGGWLDQSFGEEGLVSDEDDSSGQDVAIDASGRLLVVGYTDGVLGDARRFQPDGSPDPTFGGGDGIAPVPFIIAEAVSLDPSRRIVVAGSAWNGSDSDFAAARFASGEPVPPSQSLSVAVSGSGSGSVTGPGISCPGDCIESYAEDTPVALIASATPASTFVGWSGGCSGVGSCQVMMDAAKAVTASFDSVTEEPPPEEPSTNQPPSPPAAKFVPGSNQPEDVSRVILAAAARVAPVKDGKALVRLRCGGRAACRGVAKLVARVRLAGKGRRSARRARNVVLGRSRFRLPAGKAKVLRIRLNRKGRRLLRRAGRRGLRVRLAGRGLRSRTVRLKATQAR